MDGVGYAIMLMYTYFGVVVLASILAWFACRLIGNRRTRSVARWLIVLAFYTPVVEMTADHKATTVPAFLLVIGQQEWAHWGWPSHPLFTAYAGALVLSAPVVALWIYLRERYRVPPLLASRAQ